MSKDRVKFSDANTVTTPVGDTEYALYIPKEKFEDRSFICDLVGHDVFDKTNPNDPCVICGGIFTREELTIQIDETCAINGHGHVSNGTCFLCGDRVENQKQPETQKTIDQINAMIRNVEDSLVDMKALVAGIMGE